MSSSGLQRLTWNEIREHKSYTGCWLVIDSYVYDVTTFLPQHPAGAKIVMLYAGKDATTAFLQVHSLSYLATFLPVSCRVGYVLGESSVSDVSKLPPIPQPLSPLVKAPKKYYDWNDTLSLRRTLYSPEHEAFRVSFRSWLRKHILPRYAQFEMQGQIDANLMRICFDDGFYLRYAIPKEFGGMGMEKDYRYSAIIAEEVEHNDCSGFFINLGNDMVLTYFTKTATDAQKKRWVPQIVKDKSIIAIATSEPEVGSDLAGLSCRATLNQAKTHWTINGRKMWISAGANCDLLVVACVTDPTKGYNGISLIVVEKGAKGFSCAKKVGKLGKHASDTCLMVLDNVVVPFDNLLGKEGEGFKYLMSNLAKERLSIAVAAMADARRTLALTTNYVHGREAFGHTIGGLQNAQFTLARLRIEIQAGTTFIDECVAHLCAGELSAETASMAKYHSTELASRVGDQCVQLFGGYGYLKASPVGKHWVDSRVQRIYGGSNDVMVEIASKGLGFQPQRYTQLARIARQQQQRKQQKDGAAPPNLNPPSKL